MSEQRQKILNRLQRLDPIEFELRCALRRAAVRARDRDGGLLASLAWLRVIARG